MQRSARTLLLALMLLALLSAAAFAAPFASAAQLDGVNVHSLWDSETTAQMNAELDIAASAHVSVLRVDVSWAGVEGDGDGVYNSGRVARLDAFVQGAQARGMKVLPTVIQTPCWASSAPASQRQGCAGDWWDRNVENYPPADPSTYGDFLRWMTSRYGGELAGVEVWNEPNEPSSFEAGDAPAAYAALLKGAYAGAKAGDLDVPVIAGALAGADIKWLQELYAHGIKGYYNGFSVHTYPGSNGPLWDAGSASCGCAVLASVEAFHAAQIANGDTTPVYVTEFGWQTQAGLYSAVSEQQQASYITQGFQGLQSLPYVAGAMVYDLRDGTDPGNYMDHYGLITADFQPKPALAALQAVLANPSAPAASASASGSANGTSASTSPTSSSTAAPTSTPVATSAAASPVVSATAVGAVTVATTVAPTTTPTSAAGNRHQVVVHVAARLGDVRAGNVYVPSSKSYELGVWTVGGHLRVLKVARQAQPFDMTLARANSRVRLVFSRCAGSCALYSADFATGAVGSRITGLPAGSSYLPSASRGNALSFISATVRGARACRGTLAAGAVHHLSCRAMKFFHGATSALASAKAKVVVLHRARALAPVSLGIVAA